MALSEHEIIQKHKSALGEARDACQALARNADPTQIAPRGRHYGNLKRALKALEGSCRQMNYHRGDTRWLKLGILYARVMRSVEKIFRKQDWIGFRDLSQLFVNGIARVDELATGKPPHSGLILPRNASSWLVLPDHIAPGGRPRTTFH